MMRICICSSLTFTNEVLEIAKMLEADGYDVLLPNGIINRLAEQPNFDPVQAKIDTRSNQLHADKIRECDIVLMCNFLKNCTPGYIGANCFAELYLAQYFKKPIFALFPLPDLPYINDEIRSFGITVLNNDLKLLSTGNEGVADGNMPDEGMLNENTPDSQLTSADSRSISTDSQTASTDLQPTLADDSQLASISPRPVPADPMALPPRPEKIATSKLSTGDDPSIVDMSNTTDATNSTVGTAGDSAIHANADNASDTSAMLTAKANTSTVIISGPASRNSMRGLRGLLGRIREMWYNRPTHS